MSSRIRQSKWRRYLYAMILCLVIQTASAALWEWSDLLNYWSGGGNGDNAFLSDYSTTTLSIQEVSDLRVRDIKRRLARTHGYSADETARMLDKKELIQALAFEEEKVRLKQQAETKRILTRQGILAAIVTALAVLCWPLVSHAWEVASINFVVYTDRKKVEVARCYELHSYTAMLGVLVMGILDVMQVWLTASVILSWVTTSKYFFPVPRLSVKPAQMMGGDMAKSSLANYGINIGSMLVTYGMRMVYSQVEAWTGRTLSKAAKRQRKEARQWESADDKAARRAARKAARAEQRQRAQQRHNPAMAVAQQRGQMPPGIEDPTVANEPPVMPVDSSAHEAFIEQLEEHKSSLDDLD